MNNEENKKDISDYIVGYSAYSDVKNRICFRQSRWVAHAGGFNPDIRRYADLTFRNFSGR